MKSFDLLSFSSTDKLAHAAATAWLDEIECANRAGKPHYVALSGGRITQKFFAATVELALTQKVSFERVHFFWADERCVPPADSESNFKLADELLFQPLKIPAGQIHRIRGEDLPEVAAEKAAAEICRIVPPGENRQPALDLIFLGLGEDGHVASLFPGDADRLISDQSTYLAITNSPKPPPNRISLGFAPIAAARSVWLLASGSGKEAALRDSLSPTGDTPFARVLRLRSWTRIFTDIQSAGAR